MEAVPNFPWNWLGSTKSLVNSILDPTNKRAIDHKKKQEYACRFMILFVPFRTKKDLQMDGCYQKGFQKAHKEGQITNEMIRIAENIQTIHNSLASGIPENTLTNRTDLAEAGVLEKTNDDDDPGNYDKLLSSISELFGSLANGNGLKEDSKILHIQ